MTDAAVTAESLTKRYGTTAAVDTVSLTVRRGEFLSLLGPSGCGKTTLLRIIAGFLAPDAGRLLIAGRDAAGMPPRQRNVGLVFQNYSLWPHMSVADNVGFGLDTRGIRGKARETRIAECLDLVRLGALAGRLPRELSGGQQQRVALARALAYRPEVLLLDEPLSALDRKLREDLQAELRALQHDVGVTTILVTHDQEEALLLSDRVALMQAGRIAQIGTPEDLYNRPRTVFAAGFVGHANLLPGRVTTDGVFAADAGFAVPVPDAQPGPTTGMIRPEHLHLSANGADPTLLARLEDRTFLGPVQRLTLVALDSARLVVHASPSDTHFQNLSAGAEVRLTFDPNLLVMLEQ